MSRTELSTSGSTFFVTDTAESVVHTGRLAGRRIYSGGRVGGIPGGIPGWWVGNLSPSPTVKRVGGRPSS